MANENNREVNDDPADKPTEEVPPMVNEDVKQTMQMLSALVLNDNDDDTSNRCDETMMDEGTFYVKKRELPSDNITSISHPAKEEKKDLMSHPSKDIGGVVADLKQNQKNGKLRAMVATDCSSAPDAMVEETQPPRGRGRRRDSDQSQPGAYACGGERGRAGGGDEIDPEVGGDPTTTITTDSGLMTANPVEDLPFAPEAAQEQARTHQQNSDTNNKETNNKMACLHAGATVVIGILVLVLLVLFLLSKEQQTSNDNQEASTVVTTTMNPSSMAPTRQGDYLLDLLPGDTIDTINSNEESPQAKAFRWLMDDPNWESYSNERLVQRFALASLLYSTSSGSDWFTHDNWLSYKHECDWWFRTGIHETQQGLIAYDAVEYNPGSVMPCNNFEDGILEHLWLWDNQLDGSMPEEMYLLTALRSIDLSNNKALTGTVSTRIGHLTNLESLGLHSASITGSIPSQVGLCTNLTMFSLYRNQMTNIIPTEVGLCKDLEYFVMESNQLTGPIPSQLGNLQDLLTLFLDSNLLTSQIPTELGKAQALQEMTLHKNKLTGPIPSQLGGPPKLWMLHLANNLLNSTIPPDLGNLSNLNVLVLRFNELTGSLPTELGKGLESVWNIDVLDNQLTGQIPSQFGLLSTCRGEEPSDPWGTQYHFRDWIIPGGLHLNSNFLTGEIPSELGILTAFNLLLLQDNRLSGEIPTQLGQLKSLTAPFNFPGQQPRPGLSIHNNKQITGPIPSELGGITGILGLDLSNCTLTGAIPSELAHLSSMTVMTLANNQLSGTVPKELATLGLNASLMTLDLSGNELKGEVPIGLCFLNERSDVSSLSFDCSPSSHLCGCHCKCTV